MSKTNARMRDTHTTRLTKMDNDNEKTSLIGEEKEKKADGSNLLLFICFAGVFFSYLLYGILQEKITRGKYGEDGEGKFTAIQVLVFLQCLVNAGFAKSMILYKRGTAKDFVKDHTPSWLYAITALTYVGAMVASNKALAYISYPTQVIGKSCKPIAVLILSVVWAGKRYGWKKIGCVVIIVIGVATFMYNPEKAAASDDSTHQLGYGELLLLVSLTCDGLTGAFQEKMRMNNYGTTEHGMMYAMNIWSCVALATGIIFTGEHKTFINFALMYPNVWGLILVFSMCSAIGQHFIFLTVVRFGPLMCSIITTTRKFFTVLASVILFRNPMSLQKWTGTMLVFTGLGLDIVYGKKDVKKPIK